MFDTLDDLMRLEPGEDHTYLVRKHRGGKSGRRGYQYEVVYGAVELLSAAAHVARALSDPRETLACAQVASYVDDFCLFEGGTTKWFEMKAGEDAAWNSEPRPMDENFRRQKDIDQRVGREATYTLVIADEQIAADLFAGRPEDLADVVVRYFPNSRYARDVSGVFEDFSTWVDWLLPSGEGSAWDGTGFSPQIVPNGNVEANIALKQFRSFVGDMDSAWIYNMGQVFADVDAGCGGLFGWASGELDEEVEVVLSLIQDFRFVVYGGRINYVIDERVCGTVPARLGQPSGSRFQDAVLARSPRCIEQLKPLLRADYGDC